MKFKIVYLCAALLLLTACSNKSEEANIESSTISKEQMILEGIKAESSVSDIEIEETENSKTIVVYTTEESIDSDFSTTLESYYEELKNENIDTPINLVIKNNEKTITEYKEASSKNETSKPSQKEDSLIFDTQSLIDVDTIELKENPITKQISVLLHLDKTDTFKSDSQIELTINNDTFAFEKNMFSETLLEINNLNYSKDELAKSKIQLK